MNAQTHKFTNRHKRKPSKWQLKGGCISIGGEKIAVIKKFTNFSDYSSVIVLVFSNQREESQDRLLITVKIHQGAVYCCRFSQDASKVVSCGADKTVKVQ